MRPSARASVVFVLTVLALSSAPSLLGQFGQQPGFGPQGEPERFEVRGKVVNSVTGEGVPHALVQMYASGEKAVFSGDDGDFVFSEVPRGSFAVVAKKPGFFNGQEMQRWNPRPYTGMVTVPQEKDALVKLTPEGIIYGRLIDENQEPIEGITVRAQRWRVADGRRQLENVGESITDDEGNFRISELMAGAYLLAFLQVNRGWTASVERMGRGQSEQGYGRQFYPGVADAASATAISIHAGAHVRLEQALKHEILFEVSGVVRGGDPDGSLSLTMTDEQGDAAARNTRINYKTGEFRIGGVPAGRYLLTASVYSRNGNRGEPPATAYVPIQLNRDISGVVVVVGRGASVGVQLDDERMETGMPEGTPRVSINMRAEEMPQFGRGIMYPPPKEDKNAPRQIEGLVPGRYTVEASPNGQGYVAQLRCGSVDLLRDDLVVPAGGTLPPIQVTLRNDGGQIFVTAVKAGKPVPAMVVLYSEDYPRQSRGGWFSGNGSMGWGVFAPGRYKVVAIENAEDLEFRNPAGMGKYLEHAVDVNLGPGDQKNVRVEVQEFDEAQESQGTDQ